MKDFVIVCPQEGLDLHVDASTITPRSSKIHAMILDGYRVELVNCKTICKMLASKREFILTAPSWTGFILPVCIPLHLHQNFLLGAMFLIRCYRPLQDSAHPSRIGRTKPDGDVRVCPALVRTCVRSAASACELGPAEILNSAVTRRGPRGGSHRGRTLPEVRDT